MEYLPTGPITTFLSALIAGTALLFFWRGRSEQVFIGLALFVSLVTARYTTVTENIIVYAMGLTLAAGLSFTPATVISRLIGLVYGIRVLLAAPLALGILDWFWFWEWNLWLVSLQILLAWGTISSGPGRRSKHMDHGGGISPRWNFNPTSWPYLRWRQTPLPQKDQTHGEADS